MKTLDRQKLDVVNKTRSNIFGWHGQFTQEFKPIEFDGFGNYGEFATIKRGRSVAGSNPIEFEGIRTQPIEP